MPKHLMQLFCLAKQKHAPLIKTKSFKSVSTTLENEQVDSSSLPESE